MNIFYIGLVSEYLETKKGYRVVLDTGRQALVALENPIPEIYRTGEFSLSPFKGNHGVALRTGPAGESLWYPARICAVLSGAAYRKDGLLVGMEEWLPPEHDKTVRAEGESGGQRCQAGMITVDLVGGTVAPYRMYSDTPGYAEAGGILKEAVESFTVTDGEIVLTGKNADRSELAGLHGKKNVRVSFARIDFAYTHDRSIIHMQKTKCPAAEFTAGEKAAKTFTP